MSDKVSYEVHSYCINFGRSTIISIFCNQILQLLLRSAKPFFIYFCQTSVLPDITGVCNRKCSHVL